MPSRKKKTSISIDDQASAAVREFAEHMGLTQSQTFELSVRVLAQCFGYTRLTRNKWFSDPRAKAIAALIQETVGK